jgi:hypothetical protein
MPTDPPTLETIDGHLTAYAMALRRFLESARCAGASEDGAEASSPWGNALTMRRSSLNEILARDLVSVGEAWYRFFVGAVSYRVRELVGESAAKPLDHDVKE